LKINLANSELVPVGNVNNVDTLVSTLGCGVSSLPLSWSFVGSLYKAKSFRDSVIEKIERHLAIWKMSYLSKGGSITLIKRTFSNLPKYLLCLFPLLVGVANYIDKLQQKFLMGWGS
jgi:hypothetical protein